MTKTAAFLLLFLLPAFAEPPRLVVVVAVDQMRRDTLTRFAKEYTGGYRRLLEKGRRYRGLLDHSDTETGPGHSTMLSGRFPCNTGIIMNDWIDPEQMRGVYCVEDAESPVFGQKGQGRSPRNLLCDTLGDWMKSSDKRTRVYSVSAKDRSAILMGGQHPDGAFWFEPEAGGFTTSVFYFPAGRPDWLDSFNGDGWLKSLPESWTYAPVDWLGPDDDPLESDRNARTSPHPLRAKKPEKEFDNIYRSPFIDQRILLLARLIVERFNLGRGEAADLLCVGLSATDTAGHLYGPMSQEIRDLTLRDDRWLGEFFDFLDARGAPWALALTADHGVLPLAEAKRVPVQQLLQSLSAPVQKRFGPFEWFQIASGQVTVNRKLAGEKGVGPAEVVSCLAEAARAIPFIERVFTAEELGSDAPAEDPLLALARHSWKKGRGGDLVLIPKERVLVSRFDTGTSHGSPWLYDREIPLLFFGPGIKPGDLDLEARTVDLGPTLARLLGLPIPAGLDGLPLDLAPK